MEYAWDTREMHNKFLVANPGRFYSEDIRLDGREDDIQLDWRV
jgi:hypothetical protein